MATCLPLFALPCALFLATCTFAATPADLTAADPAARDAARMTLLTTVTPADIPALSALLANPGAADDALFLLEAMTDPAADAALRAVLQQTSDTPRRIALLQALTRRDDPQSESLAAGLAAAPDAAVAAAAMRLLGTLATPSAVETLTHLPETPDVADALLVAAGRLAQRGETAKAIPLYLRVQRSAVAPDHDRLAALSGLLRADPTRGPEILPALLANPSPVWSGTAARLAALLPDKYLKRVARAKLEPSAQCALIEALAAVGNRAGTPFVRSCLADTATRPTAAAALGILGEASDASALIALLGPADPALADTARKSLIQLTDPKTGKAILAALKSRKQPTNPAALISVAAARDIKEAAPLIAPYLKNEQPDVRAAALNALAGIGTATDAPAVAAAATTAQTPEENRALEKTLARFARDFPAQLTAAIPAPTTPALLTALALASQPDGLTKLAAALPNDETLRALANIWKTPDAVPALLEQARTHTQNSLRIVALRGAIRLLPLVDDPADYGAFLATAKEITTRPEEKTLIADLPIRAPNTWLSGIHFLPRRIGNYRSEACCVADFNGDGKLDIAAGPYLYLAPDWKAVRIRTISSNVGDDGKGYADDFCNLILDVNKDGKPDILSATWFSKTSSWYENTLGQSESLWPEHVVDPLGNHETGTLVDIDGDGKAHEFLPDTRVTVWYEVSKNADGQPGFTKHVVSEKAAVLGTGVGDINGDGRPDIIRPNAWFEAPKDIRTGEWKEHPLALCEKDGKIEHTSNIIVTDINADGLNDILTSNAHKYGIFWYEQQRDAAGTITWKQHVIDDTWTQPHYLAFADIDGDGNKEIITGKRFMAHNGGDPDELGTLCLFYYRFTPGTNPVFRKYTITYDEGISAGLNIVPVDIDGDGDLDLVTTGKWGGPVLYENRMHARISDAERQAALKAKPVVPGPLPSDNLALASRGAKASSDSELSGSAGCTAKLNDGALVSYTDCAGTRWHADLTPMPHWAEVKLAQPAKVCRVIAHFADPAGYAAAFAIQVKKGNAYTNVYQIANNRDAKAANITFDAVETDTVRFVFRKNANPAYPNAAQLSELEVYAQ